MRTFWKVLTISSERVCKVLDGSEGEDYERKEKIPAGVLEEE